MKTPAEEPKPLSLKIISVVTYAILSFLSPSTPSEATRYSPQDSIGGHQARNTVILPGDTSGITPPTTFKIVPQGVVPEAVLTALDYAANRVLAHFIRSDQEIVLEVLWEDLEDSFFIDRLAHSAPAVSWGGDRMPHPDTVYPIALANAVLREDLATNDSDIKITIDSDQDWYYGTDGGAGPSQHDLITVVLHELLHGLGFSSSMDIEDGDDEGEYEPQCEEPANEEEGCWGRNGIPKIYDRFLVAPPSRRLLDLPNPSNELAQVLQDTVIFVSSTSIAVTEMGGPVELYTPDPWSGGSSISHLDEDLFPPGSENSLMTPKIDPQETCHLPGRIAIAMLESLGWPMVNDHFRNRYLITGEVGSTRGSNPFATREQGEPLHGSNPGGPTVWWEWIAPASGSLTLSSAGSSFDTILAIYTGSSVESLFWVAGENLLGSTEEVTFEVSGGESYKIVVDGASLETGDIHLTWDFSLGTSNLRVDLEDNPDPVLPGEDISLSATATNLGPDSATNLRFIFQLAPELGFVTSSHPDSCELSGANIICLFSALAASDSQTVTITTEAVAPGLVTSWVGVLADETDPLPENSEATEATSIGAPDSTTCGTFTLGPTIRSSDTGGRWDSASTWLSGRVPLSTDIVEINGPVSFNQEPEVRGLLVTSAGRLMAGSQATGSAVLHVNGNLINQGLIEPDSDNRSFSVDINGNAWNTGFVQELLRVTTVDGCIANSGVWASPTTGLTGDGIRSILGNRLSSPDVFVSGLVTLDNSIEFASQLTLSSGSLNIPGGVIVQAGVVRGGNAGLNGEGSVHAGHVFGPLTGSLGELRLTRQGALRGSISLPLVVFAASESEISGGSEAVTINGDVEIRPEGIVKARAFGASLTLSGRLTNNGVITCRPMSSGCAAISANVSGVIQNNGEILGSLTRISALSSAFNNGDWKGYLELAGTQDRVLAGQNPVSGILQVTGDFELLGDTTTSGRLDLLGALTINAPNSLTVASVGLSPGFISGTGFLQTSFFQRGLRGDIAEVRLTPGGFLNGTFEVPLLIMDGGTVRIVDGTVLNGNLEVLPGTTWKGNGVSTFTVNGSILNSGVITTDSGSSGSRTFNVFANGPLLNSGIVQNSGALFVYTSGDIFNDGIWAPRETVIQGGASRTLGGSNPLGSRTRITGDLELLGSAGFQLLEIDPGARLQLAAPHEILAESLRGAGNLDGTGSLIVGSGGFQGSLSGSFSGLRLGNNSRYEGVLDFPLVTFAFDKSFVDDLAISGDVVIEEGASVENPQGTPAGLLEVGGNFTNEGVVSSHSNGTTELDLAVHGRFENRGQVLEKANLYLAGDILNEGQRTGSGNNVLTWTEVANSTYEISFSENLSSWSTPLSLPLNEYDVSGPLNSSFYWRARTVDGQGVAQPWDMPRSVNIGILQIIAPAASDDYHSGNLETLGWTSPFPSDDLVVLAMKRDSVSPDVSTPDGINWVRLSNSTVNDGSEEIRIPEGVAVADDWRFYARHADTGSFGATAFQFRVLPPEADLSVELAVQPNSVGIGEDVALTISVENLGPSYATGVELLIDLTDGLSFTSSDPPGICTPTAGKLACDLGSLTSPGTSALLVTATPVQEGSFDVTASISRSETDPNADNNSSLVSITILSTAIFTDGFESGDVTRWSLSRP